MNFRLLKKPKLSISIPDDRKNEKCGKKKCRFRWLNEWYAYLFGYFWLPCPLCGKYFGGHERGNSQYASIPTNKPGSREGVCPECEYKRSKELTEEEIRKEYDNTFNRYF